MSTTHLVRRDKVDYPVELINKFLTLYPERQEIAEALRDGSRQVQAMLSEIPCVFTPDELMKLWNERRDRIPTEAHRRQELEHFITQVSVVIADHDGHL